MANPQPPPNLPVPPPAPVPQPVPPTDRRWENMKYNFISAAAVIALVMMLMLFVELVIWLRSPNEPLYLPTADLCNHLYGLKMADKSPVALYQNGSAAP